MRLVMFTGRRARMFRLANFRLIGAVALLAVVVACASAEGAPAAHPMSGSPAPAVLVGAGDIASCTSTADGGVADVLDGIAGTVITLGDNAYPNGSVSDFANCYEPTWGRHKARTRPSVGNHEYQTSGALPYYAYFGSAAGETGKGYYSYEAGSWHVIVLNSNCANVSGGCGVGSPQHNWLLADMTAHPAACTIAYWHHPVQTIGPHSADTNMLPIWRTLYDNHADIVMSAHDHNYQRYGLLSREANATDPGRGIRLFVVGTGGASLTSAGKSIADATPGIEVWADTPTDSDGVDGSFGVIKLTLSEGAYTFEFVPAGDGAFTDSGQGECHSPPPDIDADGVNDSVDNCPAWSNANQSLPLWPVPANDPDCDGWPVDREGDLDTLSAVHCNSDTIRNNEPEDAWPPDTDDNQLINLSDVLAFSPSFGATPTDSAWNPRLNLFAGATSIINLSDVLALSPYFGASCA